MKLVALLLASLAATVTTPAHSTASASGTIGGFSVQLFDLDSGDGITPSITWLGSPGVSNLGGQVNYSFDATLNREYAKSSVLQFALLSGLDDSPAATLSSSIANANGNPTSGLVLIAANQTRGIPAGTPGIPADASGFLDSNAFANTTATFNLSPNTMAVFRVLASGSASVSLGSLGNQAESIGGTAYLRVSGPDATSGDGFQSSEASLAFSASSAALPAEKNATLAGSFTNASGLVMAGFVGTEISIGAFSNVTAVPEPGTYAMLLVGLGLIGTMVRRRGRQATLPSQPGAGRNSSLFRPGRHGSSAETQAERPAQR
jgi:hypothetical protein